MSSYGRKNCNHVWKLRDGIREDECVGAICIECGAFGCYHDAIESGISHEDFFNGDEFKYDANINGKWINPYIIKR